MNNLTINDYLEACRVLIFNAYTDPVINARFLPFGFDESKHLANQAVYNEAVALANSQKKEHKEWVNACTAYRNALTKSKSSFRSLRKKLTNRLKADDPRIVTLDLNNTNFIRITDFMAMAKSFYATILADQELIALLAPFGLSLESLTSLSEDLTTLDKLKEVREKEDGDAQYATKSRNAKLDELDEICEEIKDLGLIIFEDDEAQYLEKLGILVRS